jgi:hypothetical protein
MPHLFLFDAKSLSSREILLEKPTQKKNASLKDLTELLTPELREFNLDPQEVSPDGYQVILDPSNTLSFYEIFQSNMNKKNLVIKKGPRVITIVEDANSPYGDKAIQFLGWSLPK